MIFPFPTRQPRYSVALSLRGALAGALLVPAGVLAQSNNLDWTTYANGAAQEWDYVAAINGTGADTISNTFANVDGSGVDITLQFDPIRGTVDNRSTDGTLPLRDTLDEMLNIDPKHTGIFTLFTYPGQGDTLNFGFGESDRDDSILSTFTFSGPVMDVTFDAIDIDKSKWTGDPGVEVSGQGDGWIDQLTITGYLNGQPVYPVFGTIPAGTNNPANNWYDLHGLPNPNDYVLVTGANNNILEGRWEFSEKGSFGIAPDDGGTWNTGGTYGSDMANVTVSFPNPIDSFSIQYANLWSIPGNDDRTTPDEYWGGHSQETGIGDIAFSPYACTVDFTDGSGGTPYLQAGGPVFIEVDDLVQNNDPDSPQTLSVTLTNDSTGETETVLLTETGDDSSLFSIPGGFPSTQAGGTGNDDGILNVQFGDTITVSSVTGGDGPVCTDSYRYPVPVATTIAKTVDQPSATGSAVLTYQMTLNYPATDTLLDVTVTDRVPAGTAYLDGSATAGGSESGGLVTWNLGSTVAGTGSSQEEGLTAFSPLEDATDDLGAADSINPAAAMDANGDLHVVFEGMASGADRINVYYMNNTSGSWSVPVPLSDDTDGKDARDPGIAVDGAGTSHIVFTDESSAAYNGTALDDNARNVYYRTVSSTGTLSSPLRLSDDTDGQDGLEPAVAVTSGGTASVVFTDKAKAAWSGEAADDDKRNAYYLTVAGGTPGSPLRLSDNTDGQDAVHPDVAVDSSGTAHVVLADKPDGGWTGLVPDDDVQNTYYLGITGSTPSAPVRLSDDTDGQAGNQAAVTVDGNDQVHVAFVDRQAGATKRNVYYTNDAGGSFAVPVAVTADFAGQDSLHPAIGIDRSGDAHLVFENVGTDGGKIDIHYVNNTTGSFGTPSAFTSNLDGQDALNPAIATSINEVCVLFDARDPGDTKRNIYATCADLLVGASMSVTATPGVTTTGDTVTVTAELTASEDLVDVLPVLTPGATNNMGLTPETSPAAQDLTADVAAQFVWTYTVTNGAGATPGQFTFEAVASVNDPVYGPVDFGTADSNSLIGTPVLEFRATVLPGAPGFVENFATVSDLTGHIQPTNSNTVVTRLPVGVIGNEVWLDENGDGVRDAGESGIAGVTVELLDGAGNPIDRDPVAAGVQPVVTTTDADGGYIFSNWSPGDYVVRIDGTSLQAGLHLTGDPDGTADGRHPVTLADGDEYLAADFGYNYVPAGDSTAPAPGATGAIGNRVWNDADGDGLQDPGESGIGGVTVSLLTDDNADGIYGATGDDPAATTTTAPDGSYIFDGLAAGGYVVKVTAPAGYTLTGDPDGTLDGATTAPLVLAPGDVLLMADFGYDLTAGGATVGDTVYLDANGNGSYDTTLDPGFAGVTLALEDAAGAVIATTVTDANGNYSFPGLPTGVDYTVVVTDTENVLGEFFGRGDPDGGTPGESTLPALSADNLDQDFGYAPPGHGSGTGDGLLGDTIYIDTDNNGTLSAGEGVEGVTVDLYDAAGTNLLASTTTNENGRYSFGGLDPAATYTVKVDATGTLAGLLNFDDPDAGPGHEAVVNLSTTGGVNLDQDFGYTGVNTVNGTIWTDTNADGTRQAGETGRFAGVTVDLRDGDGNVIATTSTAANGTYSFEGLPDGTFTVDVTDRGNVLDGNWHTTGTDSASDPAPVSVSGASPTATADFGYYRDLARIGDFVFNDSNNNGIQDAGELGIGGVPVTLTIDYPNGDRVVLTALSASDGSYNFENLLADESFAASGGAGEPVHTVTTATPTGLIASPANVGGDDAVDSDDGIGGDAAEIVQGGSDPTNDFGFNPVSYIEDFVFEDLNANGIQDGGEPGLAGVTVKLLNANGDQLATITTGSNGDYSFLVTAGTYQLEFEAPGDWVFSPADQGGNDTLDSDANPADGKTPQVSVAPGETNDTIDAGIYDPKSQVYVKYVALFGLSGAGAQPVPDGTGTGGNPDGDNSSNLVEYALCNDPNNGLISHEGFCVELTDPASGQIDATFTRPEGVVDVIYTLQGSNDLLGAWTDLAGIAAGDLAAAPFTVTSNGDGSETVTLGDVSSTAVGGAAGLTADFGLLRLCVSLDVDQNGVPDTLPSDGTEVTDYTATFGYQGTDYNAAQCASCSSPFSHKPVFSGTVDAIAGAVVDVSSAAAGADLSGDIAGTGAFYLQVTSGAREGERWDIASAGVNSLTLVDDTDIFSETTGGASLNTSSGLPANVDFSGATFEVLPHRTVDDLFDKNGAFAGLESADPGQAARLLIYDNRLDTPAWIMLVLLDDGGEIKWVNIGDLVARTDQGGMRVSRCMGNYIHPITGGLTQYAVGMVAGHDLACAFDEGYNLAGALWPLDQSPAGTNGRGMILAPDKLAGGKAPNLGAQLFFWKGDDAVDLAAPYREGYESNFLIDYPGYQYWTDINDRNLTNMNGTITLPRHRAFILKLVNGNVLEPLVSPLPVP